MDRGRNKLADPSVAHHLAREQKLSAAPLLRAVLEHSTITLDRCDHCSTVADGQRHGFLAVHVHSRLGRCDRVQRLPVGGSRDHHGVDVAANEQFTKTAVDCQALVGKPRQPARQNIANGQRLNAPSLHQAPEHATASPSNSDGGQLDSRARGHLAVEP